MIRSASSQDDESVFLDEGKGTDWISGRDSLLCCSQMKIQRRSLPIVPMERRIRSSWRTTITRISPKTKHPHVKSNDARVSHLDFDRCRKRSRTSLSRARLNNTNESLSSVFVEWRRHSPHRHKTIFLLRFVRIRQAKLRQPSKHRQRENYAVSGRLAWMGESSEPV